MDLLGAAGAQGLERFQDVSFVIVIGWRSFRGIPGLHLGPAPSPPLSPFHFRSVFLAFFCIFLCDFGVNFGYQKWVLFLAPFSGSLL